MQFIFREHTDREGRSVILREGVEADGGALHRYKVNVFQETELLLQAPDDFESDPDREALFLRRFRSSANSLYLVAVHAGEIVGTLSLFGGPYRRTRHVAQLGMGVLEEWWGQGIGGALIDGGIEWASANAIVEKIALQVYTTNERAISLYEARGFSRDAILKGEVRLDDGTAVDLLVMSRWL
jgi:RimJ/RimL family protein N-acetyltransferase